MGAYEPLRRSVHGRATGSLAHLSLKGAQIRFHAARVYSSMRSPSRSRRSMAAVGGGRARVVGAGGCGGRRSRGRWGLLVVVVVDEDAEDALEVAAVHD